MSDEILDRREREYLTICRHQQAAHVIAADFEASSGNARDDIVVQTVVVPKRPKSLDAGHFVSRRSIILGEFRLDDDRGVEFIGNNEIWRLVETCNAFRPFRLTIAHACLAQHVLDRAFDDVAHQLADQVAVPSERTARNRS